MKQVVWFHRAVISLEKIGDYIAQDNPQAAYKVIQKIRTHGDSLAYNPELGRLGRVEGTRELVVPGLPYILPYTVESDRIIILHVLHTSRKWPNVF